MPNRAFWEHCVGLPEETAEERVHRIFFSPDPGNLLIRFSQLALIQLVPLNGGQKEKSSFDSRYQFGNLRGRIMALESPTFVWLL